MWKSGHWNTDTTRSTHMLRWSSSPNESLVTFAQAVRLVETYCLHIASLRRCLSVLLQTMNLAQIRTSGLLLPFALLLSLSYMFGLAIHIYWVTACRTTDVDSVLSTCFWSADWKLIQGMILHENYANIFNFWLTSNGKCNTRMIETNGKNIENVFGIQYSLL